MNKPPRIVPAAILFFDSSRLLFLLTLFAAYMRPQEMARGSGFPYMMCAAPNALFLLMSLFLFFRPEVFRTYIPLYITGKSLSLFCMLIWLFTSQWTNGVDVDRVSWAVFLGLADVGTIMGMAVLRTETGDTTETSVETTEISVETVAETLPETIIEEGGE